MKAEDLKGKTADELKKMLLDLKKEQANQRFQKAAGQLEKSHEIRRVRRDAARVATFLSMQKKGVATPAKKPAAKKTAKGKAA